MKKIAWIIATVVTIAISGFLLLRNTNNKPTQLGGKDSRPKKALMVDAVVLKPSPVLDKFTTNSTLLPSEEVDLSFESSGMISKIFFTEGTAVKKGALLAKLRDAPLQAQLQKALAAQKLYEAKAYRQKALLEQDAISQETYDQAETQVETGKADIALLKAMIDQTELRAPFDGILGLRSVSEGAYVSPSSQVTHISKVSPLKIEFSVPERYSDIINKGTSVAFRITGDTSTYKATVYAADSKVDADTRTLLMRAMYPNNKQSIAPGRYATVIVQLSETDKGMLVPTEAIIPEMGRQTVYVARSGKAEQVEIIPGLRTEASVQVLGGLQFGDTVITTGILQMRQGLPIKIEHIN